MSGFSAAVKIGDLDDFMSPAADCVILPAEPKQPTTKTGVIKSKTTSEDTQVASITLSDCLACSGCVTSAETLLLQSQSVDEFISTSKSNPERLVCFTISSASRRALSAHLRISPGELIAALESQLGAILAPANVVVIDTSTAEAIVVNETISESSTTGLLLTSHCPGWTCYATKVLDDSILPLLSRVKSPEQIIGQTVKSLIPALMHANSYRMLSLASIASYRRLISRLISLRTPQIYHVLVSPCFDKKLEIIRPDYTVNGTDRSVDLVLSSTELLDLLNKPRNEFPIARETIIQRVCEIFGLKKSWAAAETDCESGGYAQAAASVDSNTVEWKKGKNADLLEFKSLLRSYGFRNIQNVTRRIKNGKLANTSVVEIMACPGGCPRGGGQPPIDKTAKTQLSLLQKLETFLLSTEAEIHSGEVDTICPPERYGPAVELKRQLAILAGSEKEFQESIRTEWKSLNGDKKDVTVSSLKW
jgi:iron only hydrogenase large subunit-like protein